MSATVRDISGEKLKAVAKYLDGFPPQAPGQKEEDVEQYYSLLCAELRRLPPPLGPKFTYTRSKLTEFGMATLTDESPSLLLLQDLQKRGLPLNAFYSCLQKIRCQGALNEFVSATIPEITQHPQTRSLIEGGELRLQCQARCKPGHPTFFWFRRRGSEGNWEAIINSSTNILVMQDVNTADGGVYVCRATNPRINDPQKASAFSAEVTVKVEPRVVQQKTPVRQETARDGLDPPSFPPVILRQPESLTVEYGQPAKLECEASGNDITYDWFKDDDKYVRTKRCIEFPQARLGNAGRYHCQMTNPQGGLVKSEVVTLTVDPVIVIDQHPPESVQGYENDVVTLECSAHSPRGPVTYQWFRNRISLNGASKSGVLKLTLTTKLLGSFNCRVGLRDNPRQLPLLSSTTRVSVNTIRIEVQPRDVHGHTGETVSLVCKAAVIPPTSKAKSIEYIWLKSNSKDGMKEPLQKALQPQQAEGQLLFEGVRIDHDGYYVCQACLDGEFVESEEVRLTVTMAGTPLPAQVTIVRHPVSWVVKEGGSFRMRCRAVATPNQPLLYQWMKNNKPIPNETDPELIRENVTESAADYATYHCEVRTEPGGVPTQSESAYTEKAPADELSSMGQTNQQQVEAERKLSTLSGQIYAREKVALLIGNQRYRDCAELNNLKCIEGEVRSVAEKLRELHFKAFVFVNLRLSEMNKVLNWFYNLLGPGVYGLFYYSGHGFHVGSTSYLMPVDIQTPETNIDDCVGSNCIAYEMQKKLCRAILVLDCCRLIEKNSSHQAEKTPYPSLGFANIAQIHSTSLGKAAYDGSKFTQSFIEALDTHEEISTLHQDVTDRLREKGVNFTPSGSNSMSRYISLRDAVMRDSMEVDKMAETICYLDDTIHSVPGPVDLEGEGVGSLASLLTLRLTFTAQFTNILSVKVEANLKKLHITASVELNNRETLRLQGVEIEDSNTTPTFGVTFRNLQRLNEPLCLSVSVKVRGPGQEEVCGEIKYRLPGPTLSALLS